MRQAGEDILKQPPSKYEIPDGKRLLATSRRVLDRVRTLGLLHRLAGEARFAERAWQELETAGNFKDWNPSHYLDTAEMTHAFALGYDWLHGFWTPERRDFLRRAMVKKGLQLGLPIVRNRRGWAAAHHNWNQVCNGGLGIGALALAEVEPELAGDYLEASLRSLQVAMRSFAPDGAWNEGPGYWNYATAYNIAYLAALDSALGTDFGLSQMPGFPETGWFPIYTSSPAGLAFSFADAHAGRVRAPQLFWLARRFQQPALAWCQRRAARPDPLDLIWYAPAQQSPTAAGLPLDRWFRQSEAVSLRGAWEDPGATFVAFKAGDNKANHSHLDIGTFVLDSQGQRFAEDIGADDYNMPGYFGGQRWTYYRLRAEGHNTLVLNPGNGPDQDPRAATRIVKFESKPDRAFAIGELTPAYATHARQVRRGIMLLGRRDVLVQDEIETARPADTWWFLHTEARAELAADGRSATLQRQSARLRVQLLSPPRAKFALMDAKPLPSSPNPEVQNKNSRIRKLALHLAEGTPQPIAVFFSPADPATPPALRPLAAW